MVPFHDAVAKAPSPAYEAHDFATVFDEEFALVPVTRGDIADDTVFVDSVHLTDRGSEIGARHLIDALRLRNYE